MATIKYWNGSAWELAIVGKQGPAGATGPTGPDSVTTKGDIATYSTTPTRLPVGANGETLVADSSASVGLRYSAATGQNPIINGAFDIWQRGTSFSAASNNTYTADRWSAGGNGNALTVSRQSTNDTTNLPNIQYCARVQRDSGNTNTFARIILQNLETANTFPFIGKTITLSFYARKGADYSSASDALDVRLTTGTGTDQNSFSGYTGASNIISSNVTLTTTWQRFSLTATVGTTALEMSPSFRYTPVGTAGAADYFEVTGVQIDIGSVALPFRRSGGTLAGELAACQRYYYRQAPSAIYANFGWGNAETTGYFNVHFYLPVTMRTAPTGLETSAMNTFLYQTGGTSGTTPTTITMNANQTTANLALLQISKTTTFTVGAMYLLGANNTSTAYLGVSAEL